MAAPHVVIVGGGFGGLYAARALRRVPVRVTLVDRRNHHVFQPLLYQVATAALAAPDVAAPIRHILRAQANTTVLLGTVEHVDLDARRLLLTDGVLDYDRLIVAAGANTSYFGHPEWEAHAPGLKSITDAFEVRRRVLLAFEAAEREPDAERRKPWLTFVVVGGGATGVELAGAMADIARHTLARDFRNFDPRSARIVLVEAADRVLPPFAPESSAAAARMLEGMGVELRMRTLVTGVDATGIALGGERIDTRTVVWAAGVRPSPLAAALGAPLHRSGRVMVEPDLSLPGHPEVFVVGDMAYVEQDGAAVPAVAQGAIQGGRQVARNLALELAGKPREAFRYRDLGNLATVGRSSAVAEFGRGGRLRFAGIGAWLLWIVVHIMWLIGFRNRVMVMLEWTWFYLSWQRSARIVLETPVAATAQTNQPPVRSPAATLQKEDR